MRKLPGSVQALKDYLVTRRQAYVQTFAGPVPEKVLKDLARFCRARETTVHPDDRMTYVLEGRREVWLRIQQHLRLSDEELWDLLGGGE